MIKRFLVFLSISPMLAFAQPIANGMEIDDARMKAIDSFRACLHRSSLALDDGISPASDIARAAATDCEPKWLSVLIAGNENTSKMNEYPSRTIMDTALRTVLETRRVILRNKK